MSRGRPTNIFREAARRAGEKTFSTFEPCKTCGTDERYVSNSACVACSVARGNARYAALGDEAKKAQAAKDHARYVARKSTT
jgi:hypothetical protein